MLVTDETVAPLHELLARQPAEHDRLFGLLDQNAKKTGVIKFVGATRSHFPAISLAR